LAATQANWHASKHQWAKAALAFDRLLAADPTESGAWLRTPGLLRLATALLHQNRPAVAAMLLQGGAKRRTQDSASTRVRGFGMGYANQDGTVRVDKLEPNSPAARSKLLTGDVIVKVNGVEMAKLASPDFGEMLEGAVGRKLRLTVRHPGRTQTEDVDLVNENYLVDEASGDLFVALLAALKKRLAQEPRDPGLLELRAELAGQETDFARQVADYTAAIALWHGLETMPQLAEQPAEAVSSHLRRLYRRRGDAYVSLQKWPEAVADYTHVVTPETTDVDLLSKWARAQEGLQNWEAAAADWSRAATGNPQGAKLLAEFARRLAAEGQVALAKAQFEKSQALYERLLEADPDNSLVAAELAQLLLDKSYENENATRWTVLKPTEMKSEGGATLTLRPDGSVLASGTNPDRDIYSLVAKTDLKQITAIRLEALPDPSLPSNGPGRSPEGYGNGNFHLNKLRVFSGSKPCALTDITVAYDQAEDQVQDYRKVIDGKIDESMGWSNYPRSGEKNTAIVATRLQRAPDGDLRIELYFSRAQWTQHNLGRFRLSVSGDPAIFVRERRRFAAMAALKVADPWAMLAAAYHIVGDQQALDRLFKHHPAATAGIGDLYAAAEDWERAIAEYGKLVTGQPADSGLLTKLAAAYQSAGRTREAVPYLATESSANPMETELSMKVAALQAWFGQDKELAATRQRILAYAKDTNDASTAEGTAKACSLLPSTDKAQLEAVLALARKAVDLSGKDHPDLSWFQMTLGMAEYRNGNYAAADKALLAAVKAGPNSRYVTSTSPFYRAMSLFRQGKVEEARKLALAATATMKPLPQHENNPLAGDANHDDLILWLAYKEAKALIQFDAASPPKAENDKK
jgi:tetratricopeptide (TPR) repeat protein